MKNTFIYLILFVVFAVAVIDMYYKPMVNRIVSRVRNANLHLPLAREAGDNVLCAVEGYKWEGEGENCDCTEICSPQHSREEIAEGDVVVLFNKKLTPGVYCLPKGHRRCLRTNTIPVYMMNGWHCLTKNSALWRNHRPVACYHPDAANPEENRLHDFLLDVDVNFVPDDPFERHGDEYRYRCLCESKDRMNNKMINLKTMPFECVPDKCLRNVVDANIEGWNQSEGRCVCGPLSNEDPNDPTSPCAVYRRRVTDGKLQWYARCETSYSERKEAFHCPGTFASGEVNALFFEKDVAFDGEIRKFVDRVTSQTRG